ncbi:PREDICTED: probable ADP-ribosylation factor GTPase-activating protein AGD15 [Ipomoea nil]|uniref:probable ADP-ribosylation factor GTPase-activating protein AGD15 n=1 Tax=Ipomoea nil TaxID=35883 RepID=UPI000900DFD5|nr:PREDICTED: probable ADP-ribosylation factor GTPase-activating protein AGD15 [Ipomoea nil]
MNEKATVSRELDAEHTKILEELLTLPENMECADCRDRSPKWASINLGIFICMQCSGIHRSLGVHISKVRSTTLDTWLPDQIAFVQSMGNEKANSYWEALLPPDSDRSDIEKFIRAKYEEKKWVSEDVQLINMISERHSDCDKPIEGGARIPRKARKYSLEEDIFDTKMSQVASTRPRWGSVDMSNMTDKLIVESPPSDVSVEQQPSKVSDTATDLFSLLYAPEVKQDRVVVPPSRWATFECTKCSTIVST